MGYRYKSITRKGKGKSINEDAIAVEVMDEGVLCIVCDGLSSKAGGSNASKSCVQSIKNFFISSDEKNNLTKIRDSIIHANSELYLLTKKEKELVGMATTSEVLFINNHNVCWGHTGDSRIYCLQNNKLYQLTKDHSLVQEMLDSGYISMRDVKKYPNKNVIMNALGDSQDITIDTSKLILSENDSHRFLVCSDGVTMVINNFELENTLQIINMNDCIGELDKMIQSRGAPDDYSIIIVEHD